LAVSALQRPWRPPGKVVRDLSPKERVRDQDRKVASMMLFR